MGNFRTTDILLYGDKIEKLVLSNEVWFALRRDLNNKNERYWFSRIHAAIREVALLSLESESQNVIVPALSEKSKPCHWVQVTITQFKELAE